MPNSAHLPKAGSHEKLVINLWRNSDGVIFTRNIEILDEVTRVRFTFGSDLQVSEIFTEAAVRALTDVLDDASQQSGMLSMPDLKIQLQGILLSGCRVIVTAAETGIEHIMVRFVKYYGRITSLFREGFSQKDSLAEDAVDHAVCALEQVYLPLRNFSYYLNDFIERFPDGLERQHLEALENIRKEINTLGYFTDLINHYVSSKEILSNERGGRTPPLQSGNVQQLIANANASARRKQIESEARQASG